MAKIIPFRGILYNVSKVSVEDVIAPPYDIISPEYREALYMQSPFNIVRIDFGKEKPGDDETDNKYLRAVKYLDSWIEEGILIRSDEPSLYVYEMSYTVSSIKKSLLGFLCLVKLEELGKGSIYPHECTHSRPKQDRLNLMRSCKANTSPIFSLYKSSEGKIAGILSGISATRPCIEASDIGGDMHRLWQITDAKEIKIIAGEMEDKAVFIADGHHRYETAFEFFRESSLKGRLRSDETVGHVLMFLANMLDDGITILPTHRLIKDVPGDMETVLPEYFETEEVKGDFDIKKKLSGKTRAFGFYRNGSESWHLLTFKGGNLSDVPPDLREIDVFVLHELILRKMSIQTTDIGYEMDVNKALEKVRTGEFSAAFFLNPTRVQDVEKAALSSVRMPPKSTYFYPKLLTGLVINKFI
jgi:uncharacterized protein (DUF1015 family)